MLRHFLAGEISPVYFLGWLVGILIAITVHEFAHAKAATMAGDPTPGQNGRVTLNPLAHLDPIGTIALLLVGLGWGKPVPVNPAFFKRPRQDGILVSVWGPLSNVIVAALFCIPVRLGVAAGREELLITIAFINLLLAFFNLMPVYPLDGSHVVAGLLSYSKARAYEMFMHRYGMIVLLVVWLSPIGQFLFLVPARFVLRLMSGV
jgi:Zn-dependent protease